MLLKPRACLLATCLVLAVANTPLISARLSDSASSLDISSSSAAHLTPRESSSRSLVADLPAAGENQVALKEQDLDSAIQEMNPSKLNKFLNETGLIEDGKVIGWSLMVPGSIFLGAVATAGGMMACPLLIAFSPLQMFLFFDPMWHSEEDVARASASFSDALVLRLKEVAVMFLGGVVAPFVGPGIAVVASVGSIGTAAQYFAKSMEKKMKISFAIFQSTFGTLKKIFKKLKGHKNPTHATIEGKNAREKRGLGVSIQRQDIAELQKSLKEALAGASDMLKESQTMLKKLETTKVPAKDQDKVDQSIASARQLVTFLTQYKTVFSEAAAKAHEVPTTCPKKPPRFADLQRSLAKKFDEDDVPFESE